MKRDRLFGNGLMRLAALGVAILTLTSTAEEYVVEVGSDGAAATTYMKVHTSVQEPDKIWGASYSYAAYAENWIKDIQIYGYVLAINGPSYYLKWSSLLNYNGTRVSLSEEVYEMYGNPIQVQVSCTKNDTGSIRSFRAKLNGRGDYLTVKQGCAPNYEVTSPSERSFGIPVVSVGKDGGQINITIRNNTDKDVTPVITSYAATEIDNFIQNKSSVSVIAANSSSTFFFNVQALPSSLANRSGYISFSNTSAGMDLLVSVIQRSTNPEPTTFVVTYKPGSYLSGSTYTAQKPSNVALALRNSTYSRTGYIQTAWSKSSTGTSRDYELGASYTANADITLYPYWTANTYTVTFDKQGGSGGTSSKTVTYGSAMPSITLPTCDGYSFSGYYTENGTQYYTSSGASARNWNLTSDTKLYAKWTANPRPDNDDFTDAKTISGMSGTLTGSNVGATMQSSEPMPKAQPNSKCSVWYKWTAPSSGTVTFDTIGSSFDTVLGLYTGTSVSTLTEIDSSDDIESGSIKSRVTFTATSGTTYRIAVYGCGVNGAFTLNWSLTSGGSSGGNTKYALCVGLNDYDMTSWHNEGWSLSVLNGCVNDATYFRNNLVNRGGWSIANVTKLTDSSATKAAIRKAITNYAAKAVSGDTFIFQHSSHGLSDPDTSGNYTKDVALAAYAGPYWDYELASDLGKFASGVKVVVVVDTCHSGGLFKGMEKIDANGLSFDIASRVSALIDNQRDNEAKSGNKAATKGISSSEIGWATAAEYDKVSSDGACYDSMAWMTDWSKNWFNYGGDVCGGAFTAALTWGWWTGMADANGNGAMDVYEGFSYAETVLADIGKNPPKCLNEGVLRSVSLGANGGYPTSPTMIINDYAANSNTSSITLSWSGAQNATSYNVYRNTSHSTSGRTKVATNVTSPYRDYVSNGLTPGIKYWYWVEAVNSAGSAFSGSDWGNILVSASLSKTTLGFTAAGGTSNITVTANTSWNATKSDSWLSISTSGTSGNGTIAVTAAPNTTSVGRTGRVIVTVGAGTSYPKVVTNVVTQAAGVAVALQTALDNSTLSFTTGGSSSWFGQTSTTHDGVDAVQSGALGNSQTNWLQTTVSGTGTVSFWWYVSSEQNWDFLEFLIDGSIAASMSGKNNVWTSKSFDISTPGTHTLQWRYRKDDTNYDGSDCGWVDQVTWTASTSSTRPVNDNFADATLISGASGSISGSNEGATYETGEPLTNYRAAATNTIWWVWTAPLSGVATFCTTNTTFDTVMGVYTGSSVSSLTTIKQDDDGGPNNTSICAFDVVSGTTYYIAVSGYGASKQGAIKLDWNALPLQTYTISYKPGPYASGSTYTATKTNNISMVLRNSTYSRTGYTQGAWSTNSTGTSRNYELGATYTANASLTLYPYWTTNTYGVSYALNGGAHGAAHPTSATYDAAFCVSAPTKSGYTFTGWTVTSGLNTSTAKWGTTSSPSTSLTSSTTKCVNGATGNVYFMNLTPTANGSVTLTANWAADPRPENDNFANANRISGASGSTIGSNVGATYETGEPLKNFRDSATNTIWWVWTAPSSGTVSFCTTNSTFDTVMGVYTGVSILSLATVKQDDGGGSNHTSICTFDALSGTTYYIAVSGYNGASGSIKLDWALVPKLDAPTIKSISSSASEVELQWNHVDNATGYVVYRSESKSGSGTPKRIEVVIENRYSFGWSDGQSIVDITHSAKDCLAIPGVDYSYWVAATNAATESAKSAYKTSYREVSLVTSVSAVTLAAPSTLTNVSITANTAVIATSSDNSWLTANVSDSGVEISVNRNTSADERYGVISVTAAASTAHPMTKSITVTQSGCVHGGATLRQGAREATCTAAGYTGDTVCTTCGATIATGSTIPALGHQEGEGVVTKEPTATEEGVMTYSCTRCGVVMRTEAIPKVGPVWTIENGVLIAVELNGLTDVVIPDEVMFIGEYAFNGCEGFTSVTIPDSVTGIGEGAFAGCYCMESVTIGNGVTIIGDYAFQGCDGLTNVTIGNGVTIIGYCAFDGCSGLTSVTIPNGVTSIGNFAFSDCVALEDVTFKGNMYAINMDVEVVFSNTLWFDNLPVVFYWDELGVLTGVWLKDDGQTEIVVPDGVTGIGSDVFYGNEGITKVTIPESVTSIGSGAFFGCDALESVTIGRGATNIGAAAFSDCRALTNVTIPDSIVDIGEGAFHGCEALERITIPDSVMEIGNQAFSGCVALESVTINGARYIGDYAFEGCSGLARVTIGSRVISIGECAFERCSELANLTIHDGLTSIGTGAFAECNMLAEVVLPQSLSQIGDLAFYGCKLRDVTIPSNVAYVGERAFHSNRFSSVIVSPDNEFYTSVSGLLFDKSVRVLYCCPPGKSSAEIPISVTNVAEYAFYECSTLTNISIPDNVAGIGAWAFASCSGLTNVTIPNSVSQVGESAFYACSNLKSVKIEGALVDYDVNVYGRRWSAEDWTTPSNLVTYVTKKWTGPTVEWLGRAVRLVEEPVTDVEVPTISPADGTAFNTETCLVTLSCETVGSKIYYTTNGTSPRLTDRYRYTGPFSISDTTIIKAIAVLGDLRSDYVTATITKQTLTLGVAASADGTGAALAWTTGGDAEWTPIFDTTSSTGCSAQSGSIGDAMDSELSRTWLQTEVTGKGTFSFKWKVDCEWDDSGDVTWDRVLFYTNGVEAARMDGTSEWEEQSFSFADSGTHTLRWEFVKDDYNDEEFRDCAWVSEFMWMQDEEADGLEAWLAERGLTADSRAANGRTAAECYALGLDPADATNDFRIVSIEIVDGEPKVEWEPKVNRWTGAEIQAVLKGAAELDGDWKSVEGATTAEKAAMRFFKVTVEVP